MTQCPGSTLEREAEPAAHPAPPGMAGDGLGAGVPRSWPRVRLVALHLAVSAVIAAVWLLVGPVSGPFRNHVAELVGLESLWFMASSVFVLTRSQRVERALGGVAVELWWHRLAGAVGLGLGVVHPTLFVPVQGDEPSALAGLLAPTSLLAMILVGWAFLAPGSRASWWRGPLGWLAQRSYDRWRAVHGALALFVLVAMAHGVVDSRTMLQSPLLLVVYAGVCAIGLYALVERMVLYRRRDVRVGASVVSARRYADVVVLRLLPDRPVARQAGQFVDLDVPLTGERPHPFTVVSAPDDPLVELAVQASGVGTSRIVEQVAVGDRVALGAVRGLPDRPAVAGRELWVASGIGITPFVARVRARAASAGAASADAIPDGSVPVDLVWTRRGFDDAPFVDELLDAARVLPWLTVHLWDTRVRDRLTGEHVLALAGADPAELTVLGCGAPTAVRSIVDGLVRNGVRRRSVSTETFSFR